MKKANLHAIMHVHQQITIKNFPAQLVPVICGLNAPKMVGKDPCNFNRAIIDSFFQRSSSSLILERGVENDERCKTGN